MTDFDTIEVQSRMADWIEKIIDEATNGSDRSRQSKANVLGVSDIGNCHEYVRRLILDEEPSQEVHRYDLAAFIGTAIGDHLEDAVIAQETGLEPHLDGEWRKQDEVIVELEVRGFSLRIPGHPDLYRRTDLIDFKSKDGLGVVRRTGPSDQERYQRVLYAKALIERGDMDEDCWLHNVYIDRSGQEAKPVVWSEKFSWETVREAVAWLDDVLYAVQMGEEAQRDPSREWCYQCCPFAPQCRGVDDTDVTGLITEPEVIEAIEVYNEAKVIIAAATKDKKSAESVLRGKAGTTGDWDIRWVTVPPSEIRPGMRSGYDRLDVKPVRRKPRANRDT